MKKVLLLTALLLTAGMVANAQYRFGVKAGATVAGMGFDDLDNRLGFNGGVFAQYTFSEIPISMQTEVLFNVQGAKYDFGQLGGEGKYELTYITIPMMGQYYFKRVPGLNVEFGPQFGFMTSAKHKPDNGSDTKIKDDMRTFDFALNAGAAYELQMIPVGFYARYSFGLTNIAKDPPFVFSNDKGKNRLFQFGVFVKI